MLFIYNTVVRLYGLTIKLASLKNQKAKLWVDGRKNWQKNLFNSVQKFNLQNCVWIHCASYGEFEQGRPLIEAIKEKYKNLKIVITFFSPSGYEAFKNWEGADAVFYLPLDTKSNAINFLNILKPKACVFVKYEFWVNFLFEIKNKNIPNYLVSAVFKPHHPFFKWYGGTFIKSLQCFNKLFLQDENSAVLLKNISVKNYEVCGDTRFDRVLELKNSAYNLSNIDTFKKDNLLLIAGSSWPKDEELLTDWFLQTNKTKLIIAPHQLDENKITDLENLLIKKNISYSLFSKQFKTDCDVLIFDTMGQLSKLYRYADITYVGGGFNEGLHNTLEPAVYGKPVMFYSENNNHKKYNEVVELQELNCAFLVNNADELSKKISELPTFSEIHSKLTTYFENKKGSTELILKQIKIQ